MNKAPRVSYDNEIGHLLSIIARVVVGDNSGFGCLSLLLGGSVTDPQKVLPWLLTYAYTDTDVMMHSRFFQRTLT